MKIFTNFAKKFSENFLEDKSSHENCIKGENLSGAKEGSLSCVLTEEREGSLICVLTEEREGSLCCILTRQSEGSPWCISP